MKRTTSVIILALIGILPFATAAVAGDGDDALAVMKLMPAEWPMAVVITNFQKFDESLNKFVKRIDPDGEGANVLKEMKTEIGIGDAVDFTKPFGISAEQFGQQGMPVIWAKVADAAAKIKALPSAKQEDDVWQFGPAEDKQYFAKISGDYVVVASSKDALTKATKKENRSLAEDVKARVDLFTGRDVFLHLNFDAVRESALAGIAQFSQMAPMFGMMLGQQAGGMDPAIILSAFSTIAHTSKRLVEQFAYIELALTLDADSARLALATGYKDGPIKSYLEKQKPASVPLLADFEEQSFLFAMGYHMPGGESPFIDYLFEQMKKSMTPTGSAPADPAAAKSGLEEAMALARELYAKVEGMNQIFSMSKEGMKVSGDYIASDPARVLELSKKGLTSTNSLMKQFSGGMTFEATESKKYGDVNVERYTMKADPANPAAAQAQAMMGNSIYGFGVSNGRVRFCMGSDKDLEATFTAKVSKPLGSSTGVKDALSKLPGQRSGLILLDPMGIAATISTFMGGSEPVAAGPATPAAISFSVSGHPARLDLYLPYKAVDQVMQALAPKQPSY